MEDCINLVVKHDIDLIKKKKKTNYDEDLFLKEIKNCSKNMFVIVHMSVLKIGLYEYDHNLFHSSVFDGCYWPLKKHSVGLDYSVNGLNNFQNRAFQYMAYFL